MHLLFGKPIADQLLRDVANRISSQHVVPGLAAILVGGDPASLIYVGLKARAADLVGVHFEQHTLPATATTAEVQKRVRDLNARPDIHGIIVQLPLPETIDTDAVIATLDPAKDADGFHPETVAHFLSGAVVVPPVFPRALITLLESTGVSLAGKRACIFANSSLFTRVMVAALTPLSITAEDCMLLTTKEIETRLGVSDIVITAKGNPHFLSGSMVSPGTIVIDGGITRVGTSIFGDAEPESFKTVSGYLTPVPGGVGPVTVAELINRVTELAIDG